MRGFLFPTVLCLLGMIGEALCAGKDANQTMRKLKQPVWALPPWAWYCLGFLYYLACFVVAYRLSRFEIARGRHVLSLGLLIVVMIANVAWNYIFFRQKNLALSHRYFLAYSVLVLALLFALTLTDLLSAILFLIYALYLPYAFVWTLRVWKLNS